jgi:hypothetical protein
VNLARALTNRGFSLPDCERTTEIAQRLMSKTTAEEVLFSQCDHNRVRRPQNWHAHTLSELSIVLRAAAGFADRLVVKSDRSAGGAGVFVLESFKIKTSGFSADMLSADGYNSPHIAPPFIVEAFVPHRFSPTADAFVASDGTILATDVAAQRLFADRYYTGFASQRSGTHSAWHQEALAAVSDVGARLASLGFVGWFNLDFVVDAYGVPFVVEINPRLSALQDGYGLADAASRGALRVASISAADYVVCAPYSRRYLARALERSNSVADGFAVISGDAAVDTEYRWVTLTALSSRGDAEQILAAGVEAVSGMHRNEAELRDTLGPLPIDWPR